MAFVQASEFQEVDAYKVVWKMVLWEGIFRKMKNEALANSEMQDSQMVVES